MTRYAIYFNETKLAKNSDEFVGKCGWFVGTMVTIPSRIRTSDKPTKTFLGKQSAVDCIRTLPKNKRTDESLSVYDYAVLEVKLVHRNENGNIEYFKQVV